MTFQRNENECKCAEHRWQMNFKWVRCFFLRSLLCTESTFFRVSYITRCDIVLIFIRSRSISLSLLWFVGRLSKKRIIKFNYGFAWVEEWEAMLGSTARERRKNLLPNKVIMVSFVIVITIETVWLFFLLPSFIRCVRVCSSPIHSNEATLHCRRLILHDYCNNFFSFQLPPLSFFNPIDHAFALASSLLFVSVCFVFPTFFVLRSCFRNVITFYLTC